MTVAVNELGQNSAQIAYGGGDAIADIQDGINTFLTGHGWNLIDSPDDNRRVYSAPCKDEITNKIAVFRWDTDNSRIYLEHYETWNTETHAGTNLAYRSNTHTAQPYDLSNGGAFYVFASERWLCWYGKTPTRTGDMHWNSFTGIFERERMDPNEDPTMHNYPPAIWTSGGHLGRADSGYYVVSYTRRQGDFTGSNASKWSFWSNGLSVHSRENGGLHTYCKNPFSDKYYVYNILVGYGHNTTDPNHAVVPYGRLYGLKQIQMDVGEWLDIAVVECDTDLFHITGGTSTDHFILKYGFWRFAIPK